jgi:hypothetical protein
MSFDECELAILRQAVDDSETIKAKSIVMNDDVKKIIDILESFLQSKPLICYGGTAINNILPKQDQFYNKDIEIPDYDFYSTSSLNDSIELANIYADAGYKEVEAKAGVHHGTYKVFVNFIPVADITQLHEVIFDEIMKDTVKVAGIKYAPANFLRMNMYLELSRPMGDVTRWEKVFKRLLLLNKHYPINPSINCDMVEFQKRMEEETINSIINKEDSKSFENSSSVEIEKDIHIVIRDSLISLGAIFIGGYACTLYSKYMPEKQKHKIEKIADFDVILEDIDKGALIVKEQLEKTINEKITLVQHAEIDEIIPRHVEIKIGDNSVVFIYEPIACHSYNKITVDSNKNDVNVGTIDTLLSFYLAFLYSKKEYYNKDKILCMAMFLFNVQQKNRLNQKGLLKRFSIDCYGKQQTLEDIRSVKAEKFKELISKRGTVEYDEWFLKYNPNDKRKTVIKHRKQRKTQVGSPLVKTPVGYPLVKTHRIRKNKKRKTRKNISKNNFLF